MSTSTIGLARLPKAVRELQERGELLHVIEAIDDILDGIEVLAGAHA
jgi:uncharacterized protein Yka (UPF0111/DUF47 family)